MDTAALKTCTIDDWLAFAKANPDSRTELIDGEIVRMAAETARHARVKFLVAFEIERAVRDIGASCTVTVDGLGVRINERTGFVPDVLVECATPTADGEYLASTPLILVEVVSPSNTRGEMSRKLLGYFHRESVRHYLVVDPVLETVDHYLRDETGLPVLAAPSDGPLDLTPPGLLISPARFFDR